MDNPISEQSNFPKKLLSMSTSISIFSWGHFRAWCHVRAFARVRVHVHLEARARFPVPVHVPDHVSVHVHCYWSCCTDIDRDERGTWTWKWTMDMNIDMDINMVTDTGHCFQSFKFWISDIGKIFSQISYISVLQYIGFSNIILCPIWFTTDIVHHRYRSEHQHMQMSNKKSTAITAISCMERLEQLFQIY